jgi:hypothetical protein
VTTLAHRAALGGPRNGSVAARRAVIRWALRMFRREWRQQLLVVTLLTVAVAAAVGGITTVYNASPADNAEFGAADHLLRFDGADPRKLEAGVAAAEKWFGTTEVIEHRSLAVPGGVETSTSGHRTRMAPTAVSCSRSAGARIRWARARSPSPTVPRSSYGSRSGRRWRSTAGAGRSWASSRTRAG